MTDDADSIFNDPDRRTAFRAALAQRERETEARVRAELAEEAAAKIQRCYTVLGAKPGSAVMDIAEQCIEIIREVAAGSSPDTAPPRCGVCGGQIGVQGCVRRCNTTPEPKRRYPRTSELTDQERYEIEEAAAAHRAEVDPDEVDRRDG